MHSECCTLRGVAISAGSRPLPFVVTSDFGDFFFGVGVSGKEKITTGERFPDRKELSDGIGNDGRLTFAWREN